MKHLIIDQRFIQCIQNVKDFLYKKDLLYRSVFYFNISIINEKV